MKIEVVLLESLFCLPVTGVVGLVVGIILGKTKKDPTMWWKGLVVGALVGLGICIFFAILHPCGGFIGLIGC